MRLTLVLPELAGGGAERVFIDIAGGLAAAGEDVELLTVRDGGRLADAVPAIVRRASLGGGDVVKSIPALARHLRRTRPDVVVSAITHMNVATILAARAVRPRPRVVITHHNHLSTFAAHASGRDRLFPLLARATYRLADRRISVSEGTADDLAEVAHLDRRSIDVVYNPVPFDDLRRASQEPVAHPWADEPRPLVVAVGRLTAQKDFPTLLRAMTLVPEAARLVILGEGEDREQLAALVERLGLQDRVSLPGFVANPYPLFAAADVVALSSAWEGLPTVLIEALAFDAAIVATDCPSGPREILADGRWGRLVPVGDHAALAAGITDALDDDVVDRKLAMRPYDSAAVIDRYLAIITSL